MAYATVSDVQNRLSDYGALAYLDWDGDGRLNAAEKARVSDAIAFVEKVIDGKLKACGKKVTTAGAVIKEVTIWLAAGHMPKRGQQAAWITDMAKAQMGILEMLCQPDGLRIDDEVGPLSGTATSPKASNPRVDPDKGVRWD